MRYFLRFFVIFIFVMASLFAEEEPPALGSHRIFQFENEHVRVWKTVILPHQPLYWNHHYCSYVIVGLKGGTVYRKSESEYLKEVSIETGTAHWEKQDERAENYRDFNDSDEPIEVMIIEIRSTYLEPHE